MSGIWMPHCFVALRSRLLLLLILPSDNVQRLFRSCHPHTFKRVAINSIQSFKHGRCYQSGLNTWPFCTNHAVPLMNDYWLLTDVSPINLKGWHLLMPYQSNLTRWSVHPNGVPPNEKIDSPITYRCFATTGLQHPRAMDPQIHFLLHPGQNLSNPLLTVFPPTLTIPFSASMCEPHAISTVSYTHLTLPTKA